jgi:hypothetical protein
MLKEGILALQVLYLTRKEGKLGLEVTIRMLVGLIL